MTCMDKFSNLGTSTPCTVCVHYFDLKECARFSQTCDAIMDQIISLKRQFLSYSVKSYSKKCPSMNMESCICKFLSPDKFLLNLN